VYNIISLSPFCFLPAFRNTLFLFFFSFSFFALPDYNGIDLRKVVSFVIGSEMDEAGLACFPFKLDASATFVHIMNLRIVVHRQDIDASLLCKSGLLIALACEQ